MGHGSHVARMTLVVITLSIISLTLIARSSFNAAIFPGLKELHHTYSNGAERSRFLVELRKSLSVGKPRNAHPPHLCPSPSPAPAPAPAPHFHSHGHPMWHHHHRPLPQAHKAHREDQGSGVSRELAAGLASVGIACALICAIGAILGFRKFKKRRRRQRRGVSGLSKCLSSQTSVKKVTSDPGPDLFYLDSLEAALESGKCSVALSFSGEDACPNHSMPDCALDETQCSNKEIMTTNVNNNEISEHEFDGSNTSYDERIIPVEVQGLEDKPPAEENHLSDDDESFHSLCNSQASQFRLSNASSSCSVGENLEAMSNGDVKEPHCSATVVLPRLPPPLPPPPPPPPHQAIQAVAAPSSMKMNPNALNPSPLSSSQNSVSLSTSVAANATAGIPPPPRPPPLSDSHFITLKGPPPPPYQLTQTIPLGKDGSPLPKLKPLHWDKVRAVPNRTTVWDKLRSSSFE